MRYNNLYTHTVKLKYTVRKKTFDVILVTSVNMNLCRPLHLLVLHVIKGLKIYCRPEAGLQPNLQVAGAS